MFYKLVLIFFWGGVRNVGFSKFYPNSALSVEYNILLSFLFHCSKKKKNEKSRFWKLETIRNLLKFDFELNN